MATIYTIDKKKRPKRALQFRTENGMRKTIRLGAIGYDVAQEFKRKVERLLSWRATGDTPDAQTARWVSSLSDDMHDKLVKAGLVSPRVPVSDAPKLSEFLDKYIRQRTDLKPSSIKKLKQTIEHAKAYFTAAPSIDTITADNAKDWRVWLLERGLAEATVRQHCRNAKAIFNDACERELIKANPFRKLKSASIAAVRDRYVTTQETHQILESCPNAQWRALFGLARLAGLRVPSETPHLTWADVNWDKGRLNVYAPKTNSTRIVPIVPQLAAILQEVFDKAEPGNEQIIALSRNNLRRDFHLILKRASIAPWEDCFQTLRRSCETQWSQHFPQHVVSTWMGHSIAVSAKHYLQVTTDMYDLAAGVGGQQVGLHRLTHKHGPANSHALPNALQQPGAQACNASQGKLEGKPYCESVQEDANGSSRIRTRDRGIMSPQLYH